MSKYRYKIEINIIVDEADYPTPSDGRLALSLAEDIQEAIEENVGVTVNKVKATKTGTIKEINDDYDQG